jgi:hypothetical protein
MVNSNSVNHCYFPHYILVELEKESAEYKQEYEDLQAKYDLLEEDYVVVKAQLTMEKEQIEQYDCKLIYYPLL